jgi:hypothetical protein
MNVDNKKKDTNDSKQEKFAMNSSYVIQINCCEYLKGQMGSDGQPRRTLEDFIQESKKQPINGKRMKSRPDEKQTEKGNMNSEENQGLASQTVKKNPSSKSCPERRAIDKYPNVSHH